MRPIQPKCSPNVGVCRMKPLTFFLAVVGTIRVPLIAQAATYSVR
jgi:hypothetical protein